MEVAAAVTDAPLAVYPLVQGQRSSLFTAAVNHLLQHVIFASKRQASYLHATTHEQEHCAVALESGDTWGAVVNRLGTKDTQLMMYVKPVDDPVDFCGEQVDGEFPAALCVCSMLTLNTASPCNLAVSRTLSHAQRELQVPPALKNVKWEN